MDIRTFAGALPHGAFPPVENDRRGVHLGLLERADFVSPRLSDLGGSVDAPAVLITAPAAAGKTTAGVAIAGIAGAALLDLAEVRPVADGSFVGLLEEAFGDVGGLAVRRSLRSGTSTLVIDALDEAQVKSRDEPFNAFLSGLAQTLRISTGINNVILLARRDTSDFIVETFNVEGVPLRLLEIEYFDESEAFEFIALKLDKLYDQRSQQRIHRKHEESFEKARNQLFDRLSKSMGLPDAKSAWLSSDGRRLLGYSPILEGLATYLCVDDFRVLTATGTSGESGVSEWALFTGLMTDLLEREQNEKFLSSWPSELEKHYFKSQSEIGELYGIVEQCERLLLLNKRGLPKFVNKNVPPDIEKSYEDAVSSQLFNHPFLAFTTEFASPLFVDLARSVVLKASTNEDLKVAILREVRDPIQLPSAAIGPFLLTKGPNSSVANVGLVDIIIKSLLSRSDTRFGYSFIIACDERSVSFGIDVLDGRGVAKSAMVVELDPIGWPVLVIDSARDLTITGAKEIVLTGESFKLGPNVMLDAEEISFVGTEVHVDASGDVIIRGGMISADWAQQVFVHGESFIVMGELTEGWPQLHARPLSDPAEDGSSADYIHAVRKLLSFFRGTTHLDRGQLAAVYELVESKLLTRSREAKEIAAFLTSHGWLFIQGPDLVLEHARLRSAYGVSTSLVYRQESREELQTFVAAVISEL